MAPPNPRSVNTAKLVLAAIGDLRDSKGSSLDVIVDHIENQFSVPNEEFAKHLNVAIDKGIAFGAIKKLRGRYLLGEAMDYVRMHRRRRSKNLMSLERTRRRRNRRRRRH